jgi:hypothetical protein
MVLAHLYADRFDTEETLWCGVLMPRREGK